MADTEILRKIVSLLPGENCGKCGFENCGKFAVALADGKAKPTECRQGIPRLKEICEVLGMEAPSERGLPAKGWGHGYYRPVHHGHHRYTRHGGKHRQAVRHHRALIPFL